MLRRVILPVVKAWPGDHGRRLAQHRGDALRGELAAVQRAEIGELALGRRRVDAVAEIVLAAGIELDVGGQLVAELVEEAVEAAEMVVVPVAHDQRVELRRIDADQLHVVDQHFGRVAVVQHHACWAARASIPATATGPIHCAAICGSRRRAPPARSTTPLRLLRPQEQVEAANRPAPGSRACRRSAPRSARRCAISTQGKWRPQPQRRRGPPNP